MDHIALSKSGLCQHVRVPYLRHEEYDGLLFESYPARKGWEDIQRRDWSLFHGSRDELAAFLQTWLYFGTLTEVLGFPLKTQDFVESHLVTTRCLQQYTFRWYQRLLSMSHEERQDNHLKAQQCLRMVRNVCLTQLNKSTADCYLCPEICLSIRVLGETLSQIKHWIWKSILGQNPLDFMDLRGKWGVSEITERILIESKWCPNHIAFLKHYPPASSNCGLYYATSISRYQAANHEQCSAEACIAGNVDPKLYETQHFHSCKGDCRQIEPDLKTVLEILLAGQIPLLRASLLGDVLDVEIIPFRPGIRYTAISHVWSDGIGNQNSNWLPSCQLTFIVQAINLAGEEAREIDNTIGTYGARLLHATFWIDTICVPRKFHDVRFRRLALGMMSETYENSVLVLVLDKELYLSSPATTVDAFMRLLCSGWMRRLWTLQEGILASDRLRVLFKGKVLNLLKELEELKFELRNNPWLCDPMIPFVIRTGIQQCMQASEKTKISWLFSDMNWRSTSRKTDEAIVVATLLRIRPPNIYEIPARERLKMMISCLKEFPKRMIFAPGPRFQEEGYRWILRSFLGGSHFSLSAKLGKIHEIKYPHIKAPCPTLEVTYPGVIINSSLAGQRPWTFSIIDEQTRKVLSVKEHLRSSQNPTHAISYALQTEGRGSERYLALILHASHIDNLHAYGAIIALDRWDADGTSDNALFGTHDGAVEVLIENQEESREGGPVIPQRIHIECRPKTQIWMLR